MLTSPFKNLKLVLSEKFAWEFVTQVNDLIVLKLRSLTDAEMKEIDKNSIQQVLEELKRVSQLALDDLEVNEICETTSLILSLKFLKSTQI